MSSDLIDNDDGRFPAPLRYLAAHVPLMIGLPLGVVLSSLAMLGVGAMIASQRGYAPDASLYELMPLVLPEDSALRIAVGTFGNQLAFGVVILASLLRWGPRTRQELALERAPAIEIGLVVVGMYALSVALNEVAALTGWDQAGSLSEIRRALDGLSLAQRALMLPVTALMAGSLEEMLFRGLFLTRMRDVGGAKVALVLSAFWFGVAHFDPLHAAAAGLMGLFLGWVVLRGGSLIPAICAHILNNALATLFPGTFSASPAMQAVILVVALSAFAGAVYALQRRW